MQWKFTINDIEIDEPLGFSDIKFVIMRDELWHGIFIEASTSRLGFYGNSFDIVSGLKQSYGVDAVGVFTAYQKCEGQTEFTEVISGKLNFAGYEQTCGAECIARLSIEQKDCSMVFKNRFDQKVELQSEIAFDKITPLPAYDGIGFTMPFAPQELPISADAVVADAGDPLTFTEWVGFATPDLVFLARPSYAVVNDNSISFGELDNPINVFQDPGNTFYLTPQVLLGENNNGCLPNDFTYNIRLKGTFIITDKKDAAPATFVLNTVVDMWDGNGVHALYTNGDGDATILENTVIGNPVEGVAMPFDVTYTGTAALPVGWGFYAYLKLAMLSGPADIKFDITFDKETFFFLSNTKICAPTDVEVNLINESLSRATEIITDGCLRVKSDYFGRVDSQPYESEIDGCGSLEVITTGLKIRQAEDKPQFISMREMMQNLRAIHNIGMGIDGLNVRVEPAEWFYKDSQIMAITLIPEATHGVKQELIYSNIIGGYDKWQIQSKKGIDEFNSQKEYRTGIKSVNNTLDIRSKFVTAGYVIETVRTNNLINSGNTDTAYDDENFLICVERGGYNYIVEQGIISSPSEMFSPLTVYNWRVRPIYNLMRWFKSIAQAYVNLADAKSKLFFTSGTGNYLAAGEITDPDLCKLESHVVAENTDIGVNDFAQETKPIYQAEDVQFDYPMNVNDYIAIKNNPYGYISVQCGTGESFRAFIQQIEYIPAQGLAKFNLIKKW